MQEISSGNYLALLPLFTEMDRHLSIRAVLEGALPGRVYANSCADSALVMNPQGFLFGGEPNPSFLGECAALLRDELLPLRAERGDLDYTVFFPDGWLGPVTESLKELKPMLSRRMTWSKGINGGQTPMPGSVQPLIPALLAREDLQGVDWTIEEILGGWPSAEEFFRRGFGSVAIAREPEGERIIAWSLTDWVLGDRCEIGVEVQPEYRRRGIGTDVVLGTLSLAAGKGITRVGWQCWSDNTGSQGVARAAGFHKTADFPVLFGWNLPLNNALINGNYYMTGRPEYGVAQDLRRAAESYTLALDQGWDWGGSAVLYYNTACLLFRLGELERARKYYQTAVVKGFAGVESMRNHEWWQYTYHEPDAEEILRKLSV